MLIKKIGFVYICVGIFLKIINWLRNSIAGGMRYDYTGDNKIHRIPPLSFWLNNLGTFFYINWNNISGSINNSLVCKK